MIGKMGGTFSKQSLKFELIAIYEEFIKENYPDNSSSKNYNPELIKKAQELYNKSGEAGIIFGEPFTTAIDRIENIAWSFTKSNSDEPWTLTLEEAKKILEELKKT
jgi:hypothetical protein